ncbi:MAG: hypothetical protein LQ352_004480 [Teloschistes flavicans]|nr:MAG: hypothetical protein LQ352_004480 [Teloschistes flavicans]
MTIADLVQPADPNEQSQPDLLTILKDVEKLRERSRISRGVSEKDAQALLENVPGYRGEYEDNGDRYQERFEVKLSPSPEYRLR